MGRPETSVTTHLRCGNIPEERRSEVHSNYVNELRIYLMSWQAGLLSDRLSMHFFNCQQLLSCCRKRRFQVRCSSIATFWARPPLAVTVLSCEVQTCFSTVYGGRHLRMRKWSSWGGPSQRHWVTNNSTRIDSWFRSVVVITSALHAEGPRFDPGRNQFDFYTTVIFHT